jgi:hypothetical protein
LYREAGLYEKYALPKTLTKNLAMEIDYRTEDLILIEWSDKNERMKNITQDEILNLVKYIVEDIISNEFGVEIEHLRKL